MRLNVLAIAAACALAPPAAAQRPAFQVTELRTEAAGFAVTHELIIRKLVTICASVKDAPAQDPEQVLKPWSQRNWERLEAAHGYLFYLRAMIAAKQGKEAAEASYKRIGEEIEQNAAAELSGIFSEQGPTPGACAKWIATIAQKRADLDWKPQYVPVLDEIVAFHRTVVGKPKPAPR